MDKSLLSDELRQQIVDVWATNIWQPVAQVRDRLVQQGVAVIVRARHALYSGEAIVARGLIARLRLQDPGLPELRLLEAEMLLISGQKDEARSRLEALSNDPNLPEWIRQPARYILNNEIQS